MHATVVNQHTISITLPDHSAGLRFDRALAQALPDYSRTYLQGLILDGQVTVNGAPARSKDRAQGGEQVVVHLVSSDLVEDKAENIPLAIVHEDEDVLIINKPPGLVVHPAVGNRTGTVLNALLNYAPQLSELPRGGIVHRLDKDTSGAMVVAKNLVAQQNLVRQLAARTVKREYVALVKGELISGGTVNEPIGRHRVDRKRMAVVAGGRESITHYSVRSRYAGYTLVDVKLETGRTHQIRVHMAHIRHPVVGDPVYGGRIKVRHSVNPEAEIALRSFTRQALHAERLGLMHPGSGKHHLWTASLPDDFLRLLAEMDRNSVTRGDQ